MAVRAARLQQSSQEDDMSFTSRMICAFLVASVCLFTQAVTAFAEKVTLACTPPPGFVPSTIYFTIDSDARTVKDDAGMHPAQITEDAVTWYSNPLTGSWRSYNRQTAQLSFGPNFNMGGVQFSCVRAAQPPF